MHRRRRTTPVRLLGLAVVGSLLLSACTSGSANEPLATGTATRSTSSSSEVPSASPRATSSATTLEREVEAAYTSYLDSTVAAMASGDVSQITNAQGQALTAAQGRVAGLVSQDRSARGAFVADIQSLEVDGDVAMIRDCYRAEITEHDRNTGEQVLDRAGLRFAADVQLAREGGSWTVVEFSQGDPCVPSEIAVELESRYLAFWDAIATAGQPPDPDHPDLADTASGEQLEGLRARLSDFRDAGYEVRDDSTPHPRAVRLSHDDTVAMVRDCRELDPAGGVYDAETGKMVDGGAEPGQHALWETRLELLDSRWMVVDADLTEEESACDPATS